MSPQQAIEFFGSRGELAARLGVTEAAVYLWVKQGWIAYDRQCHIQVESEKASLEAGDGRRPLVASWDDVPEGKRRISAMPIQAVSG